MITLNLLPDIKKDFLRSQRVKRLFLMGALLVSGVFISLVVLLATFVFGAQGFHLNEVQDDIDQALSTLKSQPELSKVVTIQKQLEVLPDLHSQRAAVERLTGYIGKLIPADITLSQVEASFTDEQLMSLSGAGPDTKAINVFVDTLKNATFDYEGNEDPIRPFKNVVLDSFSVEDEGATYNITLEYDPLLFDSKVVGGELTVPKITSSTSVQERPVLFQELQSDEETQ